MQNQSKGQMQFTPTLCESLEGRTLYAFGVTTGVASTGIPTYVLDNGGNLKVSVLRGGSISSTIHLADVTSIEYKGQQMLAPFGGRYSHFGSGLGGGIQFSYSVDSTAGIIVMKCFDAGISQYYILRRNDDNLYMASYLPSLLGEARFIFYTNPSVLTNLEDPSNLATVDGSIEASDVYADSATGYTHSKFYHSYNRRMIDDVHHGITGSGVGMYMFMGNREHGTSGPFFKDIAFQSNELYNYYYSGHTSLEGNRAGLQGPHAVQFTNGSAPVTPDYSFMDSLGIDGLVPASGRGSVNGTATGIPTGHEGVVGLSNGDAQYWTKLNANGSFSINRVLPGTYKMTLYDTELEVGTRTITVTAGQNTQANIINTLASPTPIWRLGTWDGTPNGFENADKIFMMHPSDSRMAPWVNKNLVVGTSPDSAWPMAMFRDVNNQHLTFNLTAEQAAVGQTLRIGLTYASEGGRPVFTVNSGQTYAWGSGTPPISMNPYGRGITRGSYRGYNQVYRYDIPASALRAGANTIDFGVISGSGGGGFLAPNFVFDAIEMVPTSTLTNTPVVSSITLAPATSRISANSQVAFTASAKDQFGNPIATNFDFSANAGSITPAGLFTAQSTSGLGTITVASGNITATAKVTVIGGVPIIVSPITATPNPTAGSPVSLTVLGDDDAGESALTYTWAVIGTPPGTYNFTSNGTNASKNTTVSFGAPGTYTVQVTATDTAGNTAVSQLNVSYRQYIARYSMNESSGTTIADSSGANLNGTVTGTSTFTSGRSGNALQLAGGNASLPAGIVSSLSDFTIATWVKIDSFGSWARIFDFGTGTNNYMFLAAQYTGTSPNNAKPRFAIRNPSVGEQIVDSNTQLTAGTWAHIAVTLSGNVARLYINGIERGSNSGVTLRPSSLGVTTNNYLGKSQFNDPTLQGSIDDFRIYGRALSATELSTIASSTAPVPPAALTASAVANDKINLNWSAVAGATGYNIYRSTVSGGPFTYLGSTSTGISYQDTGLTGDPANGTTYYYVVTAETPGGESIQSTQASASALPSLPAAVNVQVQSSTSGSLSIAWNAVPSAATYSVARSTHSGGPFTTVASGLTAATFADSGLINGQTYFYVVYSTNISGSTPSSETSGVPTDLSLHLKLNDGSGTNALDSSDRGFNGTLYNGPNWSSTGKLGGALAFDGNDDYVGLPSGVVNGLTTITISAWINITAVVSWQRIFDFGTGGNNYMFLTTQYSTTGGTNNRVRFAIRTPSVLEEQISSSTATPLGSWAHVAVVLNGSVGQLYLNGSLVGTNSSMTLNPSSMGETNFNFLGKSQFTTDAYLNGKIDDFRIYSRPLTAVEIATLAATTVPSVPVNVTASPDYNQISLSWSSSAGASSYSILRSTDDGGPYTPIAAGITANNWIDTTVSNGTPYYYVITANNINSSTVSTQVSATSIGIPSTITGSTGNDSFYIRRSGSLLNVWLNTTGTGSPDYSADITSINSILFNGLSGNDNLILDYSLGDPNPLGGITFDSGADTDTLELAGAGIGDNFSIGGNQIISHGSTMASYAGIETLKLRSGNYSVHTNLNNLALQTSGIDTNVIFYKEQNLNSLNMIAGSTAISASTNPSAPAMVVGDVVINNAALVIAPNGGLGGVSKFSSIEISGNGKLDLHNNDLVIDYGDGLNPLTTITNLLKYGLTLLGGNGNGIVSTEVDSQSTAGTMLGIIDNAQVGGEITSLSSFTGFSSNSILIKFTWFGDSNFDGSVDGSDYALVDTGYTSGGNLGNWVFGDLDYSGVVDNSDYALVDTGFICHNSYRFFL